MYEVTLFGKLRDMNTQDKIVIKTDKAVSTHTLKTLICNHLRDQHPDKYNELEEIIRLSALTDNNKILFADDIVLQGHVSILPPVSGG